MGEPQGERPIIDITPESASGYRRGGSFYGSNTGRYPIGALDAVLARRRVAFLVIFAILLVISLVWYGLQPVEQRATASVLISRYGSATPITDAELAAEAAIVTAQIQQLTASLAKAEGVIESAQAAGVRAAELKQRISVEVPSPGNLISISYTDASAQKAADTANLLVDLYLQQRYRLLRTPVDLIRAEAESNMVVSGAELALRELFDYDKQGPGAVSREEFLARSQRQTALEGRALELRAKLRGLQASEGDALEISRVRAELAAAEEAAAKAARESQAAARFASEREALKLKADRAVEDATYASKKLQDSRWQGVTLHARILSAAQVSAVRRVNVTWWLLVLWVAGMLVLSTVGTFFIDLLQKPIYSDHDLAETVGAPSFTIPEEREPVEEQRPMA
ncbi:hypothetical protein F183_A41360 [Bryobacterales bacterium F-183]|nr:hypothetical protein F183_A41360 [Bryobacterales bacterium F-183]